MPSSYRSALLAGLLLFLLADTCRAGEAYFMVVFGSERRYGRPRFTHSWATFIRACGEGPHLETYALEWHTISWLPCSLKVEPAHLRPEPGVNLDLHTTLRFALSQHERIAQWGPYAIDPCLYERALRHIAHLESGAVRYKAVDTGYSTSKASNCIHAVADLAEERPRLRVTRSAWGELASYAITQRLKPWIINPHEVHPWLEGPLGLHDYPIVHRHLDHHIRVQRWQHPYPDPPAIPEP